MIGLVLGSLMCTAFTATIAISGGGFLACVIMSFVAITGWRILSASFDSAPLRHVSYILWHVVQPILAGVIGADIDFTNWCVSRLFLHLLCIFIGLTARSIATYLTTLKTSFTWKERLFVVGAWLPKGTLQAGLGPLAFERVRNGPDLEKIEMALDIIRLSVVTVLILAPLGAFLIAYTGPILLNKITIEEHERQRELSYLRILSLQPDPMPEKKGKHPV
ncbi:sodium/hydrogen exchanger 9B2-like [Colletes gigas]|uniref:sodium/hydrogen exchanger 9B2-like n=1 Tax=Colletes gigas TaxID=935657 RepID=UPI001C9B1EF9|nr:sodium/hydrogen exchanger 9B2-like [Colletes gigas]